MYMELVTMVYKLKLLTLDNILYDNHNNIVYCVDHSDIISLYLVYRNFPQLHTSMT